MSQPPSEKQSVSLEISIDQKEKTNKMNFILSVKKKNKSWKDLYKSEKLKGKNHWKAVPLKFSKNKNNEILIQFYSGFKYKGESILHSEDLNKIEHDIWYNIKSKKRRVGTMIVIATYDSSKNLSQSLNFQKQNHFNFSSSSSQQQTSFPQHPIQSEQIINQTPYQNPQNFYSQSSQFPQNSQFQNQNEQNQSFQQPNRTYFPNSNQSQNLNSLPSNRQPQSQMKVLFAVDFSSDEVPLFIYASVLSVISDIVLRNNKDFYGLWGFCGKRNNYFHEVFTIEPNQSKTGDELIEKYTKAVKSTFPGQVKTLSPLLTNFLNVLGINQMNDNIILFILISKGDIEDIDKTINCLKKLENNYSKIVVISVGGINLSLSNIFTNFFGNNNSFLFIDNDNMNTDLLQKVFE